MPYSSPGTIHTSMAPSVPIGPREMGVAAPWGSAVPPTSRPGAGAVPDFEPGLGGGPPPGARPPTGDGGDEAPGSGDAGPELDGPGPPGAGDPFEAAVGDAAHAPSGVAGGRSDAMAVGRGVDAVGTGVASDPPGGVVGIGVAGIGGDGVGGGVAIGDGVGDGVAVTAGTTSTTGGAASSAPDPPQAWSR